MRNQTRHRRGADQNIATLHKLAECGNIFLRHAHKQHVGVLTTHVGASVFQRLSKPGGVVMILFEARNVVLQGIQTGRRENPGLAHTAADHFTPAPGAFDVLMAAHQQ